MSDRAKVVHGLELVKEDICERFTSGSQIAVDCLRIDKAIAMLKEQDKTIYELQKELNYWQNKGKAVKWNA